MKAPPLNYEVRRRLPPRLYVAASLLAASGILLLCWTLIHLGPTPLVDPQTAARSHAYERYVHDSAAVITDQHLSDVERASKLMALVKSAREQALIPATAPAWPSDAEEELCCLLGSPNVRAAVGERAAEDFLDFVRRRYPQFEPARRKMGR